MAVHLVVSIGLALGLVLTGMALGGPAAGLLGFVAWYAVEKLVAALLPPAFLPGAEGAQPTSAVYRGWAVRLVAPLGPGRARTVEADAARLASGVRLCTMSFALRDGSQVLGHLLLERTADGKAALAWRGRGKGRQVEPIAGGEVTFHRERTQQNATLSRMGYLESVQLGEHSYWLRDHDARLLELVLGHEVEPAAPVGP